MASALSASRSIETAMSMVLDVICGRISVKQEGSQKHFQPTVLNETTVDALWLWINAEDIEDVAYSEVSPKKSICTNTAFDRINIRSL